MQTRLGSWLESCANTALGFIISVAAAFVIFPLFDIHTNPLQNIGVVLAFTVVSIIRNYIVRRAFHYKEVRRGNGKQS